MFFIGFHIYIYNNSFKFYEDIKNVTLILILTIYYWKEGNGVVFDDMYLHYVRNPTNKRRIVLFLDIKRNNLNGMSQFLVEIGNTLLESSFVVDAVANTQHKQTNI